jgi:hypothetical protein
MIDTFDRPLLPLLISRHRQAGTDQIAIAPGMVHPAHRRPKLRLPRPSRRKHRPLPTVAMRPDLIHQIRRRMRRIFEQIVLAVIYVT